MILKRCLAGLFAFGVVVLCGQAPIDSLVAQGKKDDPAKQIQALQKALKEKEQTINKLEAQLQKLKIEDVKDDGKIALLQQRIKQLEGEAKAKKPEKNAAQFKKELDAANQSIKDKDALIAALQAKAPTATADLSKEVEKLRKNVRDLEAVKKAPFVHTAILKLKKMDDEQLKTVYDEAKTLGKIAGVRNVWIGKPAENGTPELAQTGYQIGVVVVLDDANALQRFLEDPLHKQFTDKLAPYWDRPLVYDFQRDLD